MGLLRGSGKGDAKWNNAYEVMQAHKYVEEWQEHLVDFSSQSGEEIENLNKILTQVFE